MSVQDKQNTQGRDENTGISEHNEGESEEEVVVNIETSETQIQNQSTYLHSSVKIDLPLDLNEMFIKIVSIWIDFHNN